MTDFEKNNIIKLLRASEFVINSFANIINSTAPEEEQCCFCSHFPMGGDGACEMDTYARCNFKWRHSDNLSQMIRLLDAEDI